MSAAIRVWLVWFTVILVAVLITGDSPAASGRVGWCERPAPPVLPLDVDDSADLDAADDAVAEYLAAADEYRACLAREDRSMRDEARRIERALRRLLAAGDR